MSKQRQSTFFPSDPHNPKLMRPNPGPWLTPRDRLRRLVDFAVSVPITMVTAPAGYGKTTLLSAWAVQQPGTLSWISLGEDDRSWPVFLITLVDALQRAGIDAGDVLQAPNTQDPAFQTDWAADRLVTCLQAWPDDLVIVIDDAHLLDSPSSQGFLRRWLMRQPAHVHLVLSARTLPEFLTPLMREPGSVFHIDAQDLQFTAGEAEQFLSNALGAGLDAALRQTIIETSEGWIAGLQAAALGALRSPVNEWSAQALDRRAPARSLMGSVLDGLPDDVQQTLFRLSVPSRLNAELASHLSVDPLTPAAAEQLLRQLVRAGLFLFPLGDDSGWYRFHSLFRELLRERLAQSVSRPEIEMLHRRASQWFAAEDELTEAIQHAGMGDCLASILPDLVRASHRALDGDRWFEAEAWLMQIPAELVERDIELVLIKAWVYQARGRHQELRRLIAEARALIAGMPTWSQSCQERKLWDAELDVLSVMVDEGTIPFTDVLRMSEEAYATLRDTGRYAEQLAMFGHLIYQGLRDPAQAAATAAEIALDRQRRDERVDQLQALWAHSARALLLGRESDVLTLEHAARTVYDGARRLHAPRLEAQGAFYLGSVLYEQNRLVEAEELLRSVTHSSAAAILVRVGSATRLAYCLEAQGRSTAAREELASLLNWLIETDAADFLPTLRIAQARLALMQGDLSQARSCMNAVPLELQRPRIRTPETPAVVAALIHVLLGTEEHLRSADELLAELETIPPALHWFSTSLQIQLVRALAQRAAGDECARRSFRQVALEAERTGYLRALLDLGPAVGDMARWCLKQEPDCAALRRLSNAPYAVTAPGHANDGTAPSPRILLGTGEELTERELEVLRWFQERWSDKEIAAALNISPLTVKSHARNIYSKLGVHGRRQAVQRASSLGLIEDSTGSALPKPVESGAGTRMAAPSMRR